MFDVNGRKIKTLVNGFRTAGYHSASWNGRDAQGKPVASGLYFYRLQSAKNEKVRKMFLLK